MKSLEVIFRIYPMTLNLNKKKKSKTRKNLLFSAQNRWRNILKKFMKQESR